MPRDLLIRSAGIEQTDDVLDLGWDGHPMFPDIGSHPRSASYVTADLRAARSASGRARNWPFPISVTHSADIPSGTFSAALYKPVRWASKARVFELLQGIFHRLCSGGRLCLAGRRSAGVLSYARRTGHLFGNCDLALKQSGQRIYIAEKRCETPGVPPPEVRRRFEVADLPAGPYTFETRAGVFSWDAVDPGTRLLIEHADAGPNDRVLDLGCGFGAIGIVAARMAASGSTVLADVNALALECANRNLLVNNLENARVLASDGFDGLGSRQFDLILANPPTHEGSAVANAFALGAAAHLSTGGRFRVVVRRLELYARPMRRHFHDVLYAVEHQSYTVIAASRPRVS